MNSGQGKAADASTRGARSAAGKAGGRNLTIKDVARVAGVAVGTVSRVLNDNSTVMPEVRARVQAAMRDLNYEPNALARSMRAGTTRAVGCIVSDVMQLTAAQMVNGAEEELQAAGYAMFVSSSHYDVERERRTIGSFRQRKIDGLVLAISDDEDPEYLDYLHSVGVPVVLWERHGDARFSSALSDHFTGCLQATAYLLGLDHQRVALVAGREHTWVGREMARGYTEAHRQKAVALPSGLLGRTDRFDTTACTRLLTQPQRPTAIIVTINDLAPVMTVARGLGLRVPQDLSVISIGDSSLLSISNPGVTVVRFDPSAIGRTGARLLLEELNAAPDYVRQKILFPPELVLRESCAGPAPHPRYNHP